MSPPRNAPPDRLDAVQRSLSPRSSPAVSSNDAPQTFGARRANSCEICRAESPGDAEAAPAQNGTRPCPESSPARPSPEYPGDTTAKSPAARANAAAPICAILLSTTLVNSSTTTRCGPSISNLARSARNFSPVLSTEYGRSQLGTDPRPTADSPAATASNGPSAPISSMIGRLPH